MSEHTELITSGEFQQLTELSGARSPDQVLKEMEQVARTFGPVIRQLGLFKRIGESDHLQIEGWQMIGMHYRVTASTQCTRYIEIRDAHGWEATADVISVQNGAKISSADAMCMNDEERWGYVSKYEWRNGEKVKVGDIAKPQQQLRSMAQTRAQSKALSNIFRPIAKMAGFSSTPAEEPHDDEESTYKPPTPKQTAGNLISEAQVRRLFAIANKAGKTEEQIKAIGRQFGFEHANQITRDRYEAICSELMKGESQ